MNPDTPETRIGRLEQAVARIEQRVDDHEVDVRAFAPMIASHAVLTEQMMNVQRQLQGVISRMDDDQKEREHRQAESSKDSRQWRRTILLFGLTSFVSILITAATILVSVLS